MAFSGATLDAGQHPLLDEIGEGRVIEEALAEVSVVLHGVDDRLHELGVEGVLEGGAVVDGGLGLNQGGAT